MPETKCLSTGDARGPDVTDDVTSSTQLWHCLNRETQEISQEFKENIESVIEIKNGIHTCLLHSSNTITFYVCNTELLIAHIATTLLAMGILKYWHNKNITPYSQTMPYVSIRLLNYFEILIP